MTRFGSFREMAARGLLSIAVIAWASAAAVGPARAAEGPALPPAPYKPLPVGSTLKFNDRVYQVDETEEFLTVFTATPRGQGSWLDNAPNKKTWLRAYGVFGVFGNNMHVRETHGDTVYYEIDSDAREALQALWPLKVGKKATFEIKEGETECTDPDKWTLSLEVTGTAMVRIGDFDYPTYVIQETGKSGSGKEYKGTRWYHPDAGAVIKAEVEWLKSFAVKPMRAAMSMGGLGGGGFFQQSVGAGCMGTDRQKDPYFAEGAYDRYQLLSVTYPEGTTSLAMKGTRVSGDQAAVLAEMRGLQKGIAQARSARGLAAPKLPPELANVEFGTYHALVIGINNYKELPKLKTAVNDAKAVAEMLEKHYGFKVTLLLDADRGQIIDALDSLRERLGGKDNLLLYYAGHGWLDREADQGYWLPSNAQHNRRSQWVSNATITDTLKTLKAKHVMLVADSCYSGTLTRSANVGLRSGDYWQRMAGKWARVALVSGGLEPVADKGDANHSPFAKALIKALEENHSIIDGTQLFGAVRRPVMVAADQTPQYSDVRDAGHDGGDFLFVRTH